MGLSLFEQEPLNAGNRAGGESRFAHDANLFRFHALAMSADLVSNMPR